MGSTTRFVFVLTTAFATVFFLAANNAWAPDPQGQHPGAEAQQSQPPNVQPAAMQPGQDGADSRYFTRYISAGPATGSIAGTTAAFAQSSADAANGLRAGSRETDHSSRCGHFRTSS